MTMKPFYEKWTDGWAPQECPACKRKVATSHALLFAELPPRPPTLDTRKAVAELFIHEDATECNRRSS